MTIELTAAETSELVNAANAARALIVAAAETLPHVAGGTLAAQLLGLALDRLDAAGAPVLAAVARADAAVDAMAAHHAASAA